MFIGNFYFSKKKKKRSTLIPKIFYNAITTLGITQNGNNENPIENFNNIFST